MDPASPSSSPARPTAGRWTSVQRAAAFAAYYRTGSRRRARQETGVPERTLSVWLTHDRYAEERRAVQAGMLASVQEMGAQRGSDLVDATREAILVCRKALRRDPDGGACERGDRAVLGYGEGGESKLQRSG